MAFRPSRFHSRLLHRHDSTRCFLREYQARSILSIKIELGYTETCDNQFRQKIRWRWPKLIFPSRSTCILKLSRIMLMITKNDDTLDRESPLQFMCIYQGEKLAMWGRWLYNERQNHIWYLFRFILLYLSRLFTTYSISLIAISHLCKVSTLFSI